MKNTSRALLVTAAVTIGALSSATPAAPIPATPPDIAAKMSVIFSKASPSIRQWVDVETRKLRPQPKVDLAQVAADARQAFAAAAPPLSPPQADVLAAMALFQTAKDLESEARLKQPAGKGDLSPQDLAALQRLLDRKGQLESLISNVLRIGTDTAFVTTLKA